MKSLNIASTLTNINDLYIAEASEMPYETAVTPPPKRQNGFVRFMNSGWGVAVICLLVSVSVTVGILAAGRADGPAATLPGAGETHPTFAFDYTLEPLQATYRPGDHFSIRTEVKNLGVPFTVKGSSQSFSATAWLIPHGTEDVYSAEGRIIGSFAFTEDYCVQTIEQGDVGKLSGHITIPEDAASGAYDLVLSYKDEYQVFEKAITVAAETETLTATDSHPTFDFAYDISPSQKAFIHGDTFQIETHIINMGEAFTVTGSSKEFSSRAKLVHHDDPEKVIHAVFVYPEDMVTQEIPAKTRWHHEGTFTIPKDVPTGNYDLYLYYGEEYEIIENAVSILEDTSPTFDFSYAIESDQASCLAGKVITIRTIAVNNGQTFTFEGSLTNAYGVDATLVLHGTAPDGDHVIRDGYTEVDDFVTLEVKEGDTIERKTDLPIPADATAGWYDLRLSFRGEYVIFENALFVRPADWDTYQILSSGGNVSLMDIPGKDQEIISAYLTSASTLGLDLTRLTGAVFHDESQADTQRTTPLGRFVYDHSKNTSRSDGNGGYLICDFYKKEQAYIGYLRGTDIILSYNCDENGDGNDLAIPLTETEAQAVAQDFLKNLLPEDVCAALGQPQAYDYADTPQMQDLMSFTYSYQVSGYDTFERHAILVSLSQGTVENYSYITGTSHLTPSAAPSGERLQEAENAIIEKLNSMTIEGFRLEEARGVALSESGEWYMVVGFSAICYNSIIFEGEEPAQSRTYYMITKVS
ncbi:MAG: hypothetical protein E7661_05925 [Ruminococcaceae bacterium]|nr:hypothetical protein [Oscillospiraceae bacterium]